MACSFVLMGKGWDTPSLSLNLISAPDTVASFLIFPVLGSRQLILIFLIIWVRVNCYDHIIISIYSNNVNSEKPSYRKSITPPFSSVYSASAEAILVIVPTGLHKTIDSTISKSPLQPSGVFAANQQVFVPPLRGTFDFNMFDSL